MEKNVGGLDLQMRVAAGAISGLGSLAILAGYLQVDEVFSLVLGLLAVILFGTAYTKKCPVCAKLGHNSYER